jgi:hypothetical protein
MLFKHVIFLEEFMYESNTVRYEYYNNDNYILNILKVLWSFLICIILRIPTIIIIMLKFIVDVINKNWKNSNLI